MPAIHHLLVRDSDSSDNSKSEKMINMMLVILGIVFLALILVSVLYLFRRQRLRKAMHAQAHDDLPTYDESKRHTKHRGLTIETKHNGRSSVFIINGDHPMLANPHSPPHSPDNVPEIHITFPDEHDDQGRPKSGRVLVVRVGDNSAVGLEPMHDEQLPAYEKDAKGFYSIDMDKIGGLKEKDHTLFQ